MAKKKEDRTRGAFDTYTYNSKTLSCRDLITTSTLNGIFEVEGIYDFENGPKDPLIFCRKKFTEKGKKSNATRYFSLKWEACKLLTEVSFDGRTIKVGDYCDTSEVTYYSDGSAVIVAKIVRFGSDGRGLCADTEPIIYHGENSDMNWLKFKDIKPINLKKVKKYIDLQKKLLDDSFTKLKKDLGIEEAVPVDTDERLIL